MSLGRVMFGGALLMLLTIGSMSAQDTKTEPKTPAKELQPKVYRGQLPTYWKQIGLSDDQKQTIYKTQSIYDEKYAILKAQMDELKTKERKELEDILTADQKKRLRDIALSKTPSEK